MNKKIHMLFIAYMLAIVIGIVTLLLLHVEIHNDVPQELHSASDCITRNK